ncbi:unnamed protein product [marine sediment metagenome]|uniref:Uncharacterized protein n=1 Tax=marine sediment metagenome TaxID=412755 RepID=X1J0H4_9ZZZZ
MVMQQQIRPGQLTAVPATVAPANFEIGTLLTSIMPLIMLIMVFMMLKPMLAGMAEAAK